MRVTFKNKVHRRNVPTNENSRSARKSHAPNFSSPNNRPSRKNAMLSAIKTAKHRRKTLKKVKGTYLKNIGKSKKHTESDDELFNTIDDLVSLKKSV